MQGYRDRWVDTAAGALHLVEWSDAGPLVLLTHGITAQAHVWDPIAARLAERYRVLSLDQRGHGDSMRPAEGYDLDAYVGDLLAVLDALGAARAAMVGHSLGARNAFAFGALHPERTACVVAVEYGPWIERVAFDRLDSRVLAAPERFANHAAARDYLATRYSRVTADALERRARHGTRPEGDGHVWKYDRAAVTRTLALLDADLGALVPRLRAPALVVRGSESAFYDAAAFARLQAARPDLAYVEVAGATHYVPEERPDEVYAAIVEFLGRLGGAW